MGSPTGSYGLTLHREIQNADGDWIEVAIDVEPCRGGGWIVSAIDGVRADPADPFVTDLYNSSEFDDAVREAVAEDRRMHG